MNMKNVNSLNVNVGVTVDTATINTCVALLNIDGISKGYKGMVIGFSNNGSQVEWIDSQEHMDRIVEVVTKGE